MSCCPHSSPFARANVDFLFRNFRQDCSQITGLDLAAWLAKDDDLEISTEEIDTPNEASSTIAPLLEELDADTLRNAFDKARENLQERKRVEYEQWLQRK